MRTTTLAVALLSMVAAPVHADPPLNANVRPETLAGTVCVRGYTGIIRPPQEYTGRIKMELLAARGLGPETAASFQLDHIVPLCLGGHPSDPANLQLQPFDEAKRKDKVEWTLCCLVCAGKLDLDTARRLIADWSGPEMQVLAKDGCP